jgi:hypothetical protein
LCQVCAQRKDHPAGGRPMASDRKMIRCGWGSLGMTRGDSLNVSDAVQILDPGLRQTMQAGTIP